VLVCILPRVRKNVFIQTLLQGIQLFLSLLLSVGHFVQLDENITVCGATQTTQEPFEEVADGRPRIYFDARKFHKRHEQDYDAAAGGSFP
jgi:hypothetical protein